MSEQKKETKKKGIGHLSLIIGAILLLFGCIFSFLYFNKEEESKTEKETKVVSYEEIHEQILEGIKDHERHFTVVSDSELTKEEKDYVSIISKVPGIHRNGNLFTFVAEEGKEKLEYFEDVVKDGVLTIYIKREKGKGNHVVNIRLNKEAEYDLAYIEVPSLETLQLELTEAEKPNLQSLKEKEKEENPSTLIIQENGKDISISDVEKKVNGEAPAPSQSEVKLEMNDDTKDSGISISVTDE